LFEGAVLHRGSEYDRGTRCGKTARRGLHGGCRVTGIPTGEAPSPGIRDFWMTQSERKASVRQYKKIPQPAGVFRVRNTATGKSLVGSTTNLPGMLNRQRFQLERGSHPSRELQADWNALGADTFEFEVLDQLEPSDKPDYDATADLRALKEMWLEKLTASGELLYREAGRGS
jgi:hypothetical protein